MFDDDGNAENTTISEPALDEANLEDFEKADDGADICDCNPEHKDSLTIQESRGASLGGFGGQIGSGTTVIVCRNCHQRFYEDDTENTSNETGWGDFQL